MQANGPAVKCLIRQLAEKAMLAESNGGTSDISGVLQIDGVHWSGVRV